MDSLCITVCLNIHATEKHHEMIIANVSGYDNHRKSKIHIYAYTERNVLLIQSIWVLTYRLFRLK